MTFKEMDIACGVVKGSAFRAFKALADVLNEGADFHCHDARLAADTHAALLKAGRIYAGSMNAVLLEKRAQQLIAAHLSATQPRDS
jgi:hypothetical protein